VLAVILVVGATGDLGSRIVLRLVQDARHDVRCLVRAESDAAALSAAGATIVKGDLTQPQTLSPACEGVDVVVASATAIGRRLAGARRPSIREVDEAGMAALIDAAERAGVQRFVHVSYAHGGRSFGTPLEVAKMRTEGRLARSSMRRVVVRPDAFQEIHLGPLGRFDVGAGKVVVMGKGDNPRRWIGTDDVAALVAAVVDEVDPPAEIDVGGPEALSRNEVIEVAEQATGRSFKVQHMPLPVVRFGARVLPRANDALASIFGTGLMQQLTPVTWDDSPLTSRGITPRSATAWVEAQAGVEH
jgi:uncharacterized protein YbjT (DUF2867 family)